MVPGDWLLQSPDARADFRVHFAVSACACFLQKTFESTDWSKFKGQFDEEEAEEESE